MAEEIGTLAGNTNAAANEIQEVSKDVVVAIQELYKLADRILSLLQEDVSSDYKKFSDASENYADMSEENSAEIVNVSELLRAMGTDMKNIEVSTGETVSAISSMNRDLSRLHRAHWNWRRWLTKS